MTPQPSWLSRFAALFARSSVAASAFDCSGIGSSFTCTVSFNSVRVFQDFEDVHYEIISDQSRPKGRGFNPIISMKFLHTADWHIRETQYGRTFRGDDYRKAALQVVDLAAEYEVDFIINGGDTLDKAHPTGRMLDVLFEVHSKLKEAGIPMFTVTGNHDNANPSFLKLPEYRCEWDPSKPSGGIFCIDHQKIQFRDLTIAGFPAVPWQEVAAVTEVWKEPVDIMVWHGAVTEFIGFPSESAWAMEDMPFGHFKAALLGDIHVHRRMRLEDETLVSYPGSIELGDQREQRDKFVDIYDLTGWDRKSPFPEPVHELLLDTRPVLFLQVTNAETADTAVDAVRDAVGKNKRPPLIFMNYHYDMQEVVHRINQLIDRTTTVFKPRCLRGYNRSLVYVGAEYEEGTDATGRKAVKPDILDVVDDVVPPGTPLNQLSRLLADPEANAREIITRWVEDRLERAGVTEEDLKPSA